MVECTEYKDMHKHAQYNVFAIFPINTLNAIPSTISAIHSAACVRTFSTSVYAPFNPV